MKKIIASLIIIFGITGVASASWYNPFSWFGSEIEKGINLGATYLFPYQGGTGTSTAPTYGQMLVGNSGGTYTLTATSSLGIVSGGSVGMLTSWLTGTSLTATSAPTASYFTATSTTATSTFAGGLSITGTGFNFGSNTLFYQNSQRFLTSSSMAAGNLTIGYQSATGLDGNGGLYNTGVGYQALGNATSSPQNTALGYQALKGSATISNIGRNTAVGAFALATNTTGNYNIAVGNSVLIANTTGNYNTAIGSNSLYSNTTGNYNTTGGMQGLYYNTTGNYNIANGYVSLYYNTTGTGNIGLGYNTGAGVGNQQDQRSVIDNYMTFIGYQASRSESVASTTALTNGVAIGKNARVGASNSIVLGGTGADAVNVGIGTTTPATKLDTNGTIRSVGIDTPTSGTGLELRYGAISGGTRGGILSYDRTASQYKTLDLRGSEIYFNVGGTDSMFLNSSGNIGIGTTTPATLFQLFSTATTTMSVDSNSSTKGGCIEIKDKSGTGYTYIYAEDGVLYSSIVSCK